MIIIIIILSGGLLGIIGQGIRIVVGLKKLANNNVTNTLTGAPTSEFNWSKLLVSIFIGFIAGAIAFLIQSKLQDTKIDVSVAMTIITAGYSGSDFIEGLFNTSAPKFNANLPKS
jgi:uncharacterized membrane protein YeaQ/YmgE (transglycosylase-associated protein family)